MRGLGFIITTLIMTIKLGAGHITGRLRVKMGRHHSSHQHPCPHPSPGSCFCCLYPCTIILYPDPQTCRCAGQEKLIAT